MALEPLAQRAEAALWSEHGPAWRDAWPSVEEVERPDAAPDDEQGGARSFRFGWSGSGSLAAGSATVTVRRSGAVPVPACGSPMESASKTSPTYQVVGIEPA